MENRPIKEVKPSTVNYLGILLFFCIAIIAFGNVFTAQPLYFPFNIQTPKLIYKNTESTVQGDGYAIEVFELRDKDFKQILSENVESRKWVMGPLKDQDLINAFDYVVNFDSEKLLEMGSKHYWNMKSVYFNFENIKHTPNGFDAVSVWVYDPISERLYFIEASS